MESKSFIQSFDVLNSTLEGPLTWKYYFIEIQKLMKNLEAPNFVRSSPLNNPEFLMFKFADLSYIKLHETKIRIHGEANARKKKKNSRNFNGWERNDLHTE